MNDHQIFTLQFHQLPLMHFKITVYVKYDEKRMCVCIVKLSLGDLDPLGQQSDNAGQTMYPAFPFLVPVLVVAQTGSSQLLVFFTPVYVKYSLYNLDCLFPVKINSKKKNRKQTMFFNQERSLTF